MLLFIVFSSWGDLFVLETIVGRPFGSLNHPDALSRWDATKDEHQEADNPFFRENLRDGLLQ